MLTQKQPPLDARATLSEKLGFTSHPKGWLCIEDPTLTSRLPDFIEVECSVCKELETTASPLDLSSLSYLRRKVTVLRLRPCRIAYAPKKRGARFGVAGTLVHHYWAGQCSDCKVVYWAVEVRRAPNPIFVDLLEREENSSDD